MKYENELRNKLREVMILDFLWKNIGKLQSSSFYLSIVLNLIILYKTKNNHDFSFEPIIYKDVTNEAYYILIAMCQFPLIVINGIMLVFFAFKNYPIINM